MQPVQKALDDAGLSTNDINEVILVGGSTRIPIIQNEVEKFFSKKGQTMCDIQQCEFNASLLIDLKLRANSRHTPLHNFSTNVKNLLSGSLNICFRSASPLCQGFFL